MVFYGEYLLSFSAPSRIVLPKKIRELLKGDNFVITKGYDSCLAGYDKSDWEERAKSLLGVSLLDKEQIEKKRFLFSSTVYIEIDDQGRFVIPRMLLTYAGISEKAIIVGVGDHFEVWNPEKWNSYLSDVKN